VACALGQKQAEEETLNGFSLPLPFFEFFHPANTTARCSLLAFLSSAPHSPTPKKIPFELFVRWLSLLWFLWRRCWLDLAAAAAAAAAGWRVQMLGSGLCFVTS